MMYVEILGPQKYIHGVDAGNRVKLGYFLV